MVLKGSKNIIKIKQHFKIFLFLLLSLIISVALVTDSFSQYRYRTVNDTTKYNEKSLDVKIFRSFNNIHSNFVNSLVNITNESLAPVSIATPIGLYIASRINNNYYDENASVLLALSEITSGTVTFGIKIAVKRNRPFRTLNNVYLSDTNSVKGSYSFPSGHSSGSFAIATSLTLSYPDKPALIAGVYTYAAIVSLGRMYWGVHYPSDVFTGMILGAGSAALIYSLRVPIIKFKNQLFNQPERPDSFSQSDINTPVLLASLAATDIVNYLLISSKNNLLNKSKINFSSTREFNQLNYTYGF